MNDGSAATSSATNDVGATPPPTREALRRGLAVAVAEAEPRPYERPLAAIIAELEGYAKILFAQLPHGFLQVVLRR